VPTVEFFVPGEPTAQPRHKVTTRGGFAHAYIPAKHPVHNWRALVATVAQENRAEAWPIRKPHPVRISIEFRKIRPASIPKRIQAWTTKPDRDNLEKAFLDSIEGIVLQSDSQVVGGEITKIYHAQPGAYAVVEWEGLL
jgi:Holliday junction resolvase RusA-like endonuclease